MKPRVAILLGVAWFLPAVAQGQPAKAGKQTAAQVEAQKAADAHFQKGNAFFDSGGFDWAIEGYDAGLALTGEARFLFRLGRCYEDKGEQRKAVAYYQRYLAAEPDGVSSDEAGTRVAKLSAEIEHDEEVARERAQREEAEARRLENEQKAAERRRELLEQAFDRKRSQMLRESEEREAAAARAAARRACRNWKLRRAGLVTMGVGVLALGLGAKYGLDAQSANDALSNHAAGPWTDELLARQDEGESAERKLIYLTGIGATALLTGGVLYLLGRRDRGAEQRLRVQSSFDASHAAIWLAGRF